MTYVSVFRDSESCLERMEYRFWLSDTLILKLDLYSESSRQTKRHAFRIKENWSRFNGRENTIKEKPIVPADVTEEAICSVACMIKMEDDK